MTSQTLKTFRIIAFVAFVIAITYSNFFGQQINTISSKCPNPNQLTKSTVKALADGNITYTPCPTFASIFFGNVDFSNATVTGLTGFGNVSGTGTTNFLPLWTDGAGGVLGDSPISWDGVSLNLNSLGGVAVMGDVNGNASNTKLTLNDSDRSLIFNSAATSFLNILPNSGQYSFGDVDGFANRNFIKVDDASNAISIDSTDGLTTIGDVAGVANKTTLTINDGTQAATFSNGVVTISAPNAALTVASCTGCGVINGAGINVIPKSDGTNLIASTITDDGSTVTIAPSSMIFDIVNASKTFSFAGFGGTSIIDTQGIQNYNLQRTVTASGTTGARTINKPAGTVNFAAAATSLVVTNSTVNASSIILLMARTNDATCAVKNYVAGAGSFTINMTAACTAETSVGFLVTN